MSDFLSAAAADTARLRELAEKATRWQPNTSWSRGNPEREFADEVSPAVILALVAELSALRAARDERESDTDAFRDVWRAAESHVSDLAQRLSVAEAALMEARNESEKRIQYLEGQWALETKWRQESDAARLLVEAALEQAQAALERAEVFLARQMWMTVEAVDEGVNPEDAREEWDTDALLSETYDHYIALARAALAGQTTDTAAETGTATDGGSAASRSGGETNG